jgi:hypothetical protein
VRGNAGRPPVGERHEASEEGKSAGVVECDQSGEDQAAEQLAEDAHWQEKCRPRRYPALSIECDTAARHNHMHMGVAAAAFAAIAGPSAMTMARAAAEIRHSGRERCRVSMRASSV